MNKDNSLWICPKCGGKFVQKNGSHSCVQMSLQQFLSDKPERAIELFNHFLEEYLKIGPYTLHPVKTRVALMVNVRFAAINRFGKTCIEGHLWLKERVESEKFHRIESLPGDNYIHHFKISAETDIDSEFTKYMRLSYKNGCRE